MTETLTAADVVELRQLLAMFIHVFDNADAESMELVFTKDGRYESTIGRRFFLENRDEIQEFTSRFTVGTLDHHTLDMIVFVDAEGTVRVRSRYVAVMGDGSIHNGDYFDVVVRTPDGWRISYRLSLPRIPPLDRAELPPGYLDAWIPRKGNLPLRLS
jgi:hypothetical protein